MKVKFTIAYDGKGFSGWQRQPNAESIQGHIEDGLKKLYGGKDFSIMASGRTDEGVHAYGQVASVEVPNNIPPNKIIFALNHLLPEKIRILNCEQVEDDFNALRCSRKKTYCYDMYIGSVDNPLLLDRALRVDSDINVDLMQSACKLFVGEHDFKAFRCKGSSAITTVRNILECRLEKVKIANCEGLRLVVTANGFLYKMVRAIAGTLVQVGNGKLSLDQVKKLLKDAPEWEHKVVAPSSGLYLLQVDYEKQPKNG